VEHARCRKGGVELCPRYGDIDRLQLHETAVRDLPALIAALKALTPPLKD
jgi:hypothetical protein